VTDSGCIDMTLSVSDIAYRNRKAGFHFFSPETMRFWGDSLKSFRVDRLPDGAIDLVRTRPYLGVDRTPYWPSVGKRYTVDTTTWNVIAKGESSC